MKLFKIMLEKIKKERIELFSYFALFGIVIVVVYISNPTLVIPAVKSLIYAVIIGLILGIGLSLTFLVRKSYPEIFKFIFNFTNYILGTQIFLSILNWNREPENPIHEPRIALLTFYVGLMLYLRNQWKIKEEVHAVVEAFKLNEASPNSSEVEDKNDIST